MNSSFLRSFFNELSMRQIQNLSVLKAGEEGEKRR